MTREAFLDWGLASLYGTASGISNATNSDSFRPTQVMDVSPSITRERSEQAFVDTLMKTFARTRKPGWDGYGATPVSAATLAYAWQFFLDLPSEVISPEVGADADGDISLDWDFGARNVFSVRVGRDGSLQYAGLFGHETYYGSAVLRQGVPKAVAEGIKRAIRLSQHGN